jgi:hypothetical protein
MMNDGMLYVARVADQFLWQRMPPMRNRRSSFGIPEEGTVCEALLDSFPTRPPFASVKRKGELT